ncbi:MAG TPA: hypothetical protein VGN07_17880 [Steroidobacteraceae bacterium]|jgi:hypothetical protein
MCSKVVTTLLAVTIALPITILNGQSAMSAEEPLTRTATTEVRATVVAVDRATRIVTLKGQDGKSFDVEAGPAVQRLDQIKPGDGVLVAYTESLAFQVVPKDEKKPAGESMSASRVSGGGELGHRVTTSFKVASVDPMTNILWVTLPNGDTKKIHVQDPNAQQRLKTLSPGNVVAVTYTESLAVRLEKLATQ